MIIKKKKGGRIVVEWKTIEIYKVPIQVSKEGQVKILKKGRFVDRVWRFSPDGYPRATIAGYNDVGEKIYRPVAVHILVAKAFIPNPFGKPEVNHKDFNRANPHVDNLEWVTHRENIEYSRKAGRYKSQFGADNPNYGNTTLSKKYKENPKLSKEKQSRKGGQNGRAKPCRLLHREHGLIGEYSFQREAAYALVERESIGSPKHPDTLINKLRSANGYRGYYLEII